MRLSVSCSLSVSFVQLACPVHSGGLEKTLSVLPSSLIAFPSLGTLVSWQAGHRASSSSLPRSQPLHCQEPGSPTGRDQTSIPGGLQGRSSSRAGLENSVCISQNVTSRVQFCFCELSPLLKLTVKGKLQSIYKFLVLALLPPSSLHILQCLWALTQSKKIQLSV